MTNINQWVQLPKNIKSAHLLAQFGTDGGYVLRSVHPTEMSVFNIDGDIDTLTNIVNNFNIIPLQYNTELGQVSVGSNKKLAILLFINGEKQDTTGVYFNPLGVGDDKVLDGLAINGTYQVYCLNESTYESGYVTFTIGD